ncbi:MAG TPA: hypothetical protein VKB89_31200 [Xanthobacteraceae bacterium]|nr:hypothetical protein [Xanthobacteraceae bacterium]
MFEALKNKGYEIEFVSHSSAILEIDFPDAAAELEQAMLNQSVSIEEIIRSGGGETKGTQRLRNGLTAKGWVQETFTIKKTINDEPRESISHKVDHVRIFDRSNGKRTDLLSKSNGIIRTLSSTGIWRILSGSTQKGEFRSG